MRDRMNDVFRKFAEAVSNYAGSSWAFLLAVITIIIWAVTGPVFQYSSTWQLIINTGTTIVTFLMVFLVQNAQNREARATQLKLDELIKAQRSALNTFIGAEELPDKELEKLKEDLTKVTRKRRKARK